MNAVGNFVRRAVALALVGALVAGLAPLPQGAASYNGAWEKRQVGGCTCHSGAANPAVVFEVTGFPGNYTVGEEYTISVRLVSTPVRQDGARKAGFNAEVLQGSLRADGAWRQFVQTSDKQATHTFEGTNRTDWSFTWVAPEKPAGVVILWVFVNTVNGDGVPSPADQWSTQTLQSQGAYPYTGGRYSFFGIPAPEGSSAFIVLALAGAAGAVAAVAVRARRTEPSRTPAGVRRRRRRAKRLARARRHPVSPSNRRRSRR